MNHRDRYAKACRKAFEGFSPNLQGCRKPALVQAVLDLARAGMYSAEIAERLGTTPKAVQKIYRRYDFPRLHNLEPPKREERLGWKGGVKTVKGYRYVRSPDHPHRSKHGGYVAEHRLVMEQTLGRYLLPTEAVDHIDGDTRNNAPSNLRVFASNGEHLAETLKGRCPNWPEEGQAALAAARRGPRRMWKGVPRTPTLDPS